MGLTTEQVLLLNNLMYMEPEKDCPLQKPDDFTGMSIGEWLDNIDLSQIADDRNYGSFMTGRDWKNIIHAARSDEMLKSMIITETHVDAEGGGGRSAVFTNDDTNDAVVVFKGTEGKQEWSDNFSGGNHADTPYQENALTWYQETYRQNGLDRYEITVTGHSKGGNKAKYVSLLDHTVDHCVSVDGQGFSDKFMQKYADVIAARQSVIENHNIDYDYVNLLLNDVGATVYYKGYDYGKGGFLENHCPNTFLNFDEDGTFTITVNPNGQAQEMKALDMFLNNTLRSLPDEKRTDMLVMINAIADSAFSIKGKSTTDVANMFLQLAADEKYADDLSYLLAYTIEYEQAHPEFAKQINHVLEAFGMEDAVQYIDIVDGVLNFKTEILGKSIDFDTIYSMLSSVAGKIPDWLLRHISSWIHSEYGIELSKDQLRNLLHIVRMVNDDMHSIKIVDNGSDIRIEEAAYDTDISQEYAANLSGSPCLIDLHISGMREAAGEFDKMANKLSQAGTEVMSVTRIMKQSYRSGNMDNIQCRLMQIQQRIEILKAQSKQFGSMLSEIAEEYRMTEQQIFHAFTTGI